MVEMATIFHHHGPQYRARFGSRMPLRHHKVMHAIERCRTPDFEDAPFPVRPLVPWVEVVHDRIAIERADR